jgi:hypothetical protein
VFSKTISKAHVEDLIIQHAFAKLTPDEQTKLTGGRRLSSGVLRHLMGIDAWAYFRHLPEKEQAAIVAASSK